MLFFSWYHNNTDRQYQSDDKSTLIIPNIQEHHAGIYTCFAFNLFGNTSANMNLSVTSMLRDEFIGKKMKNLLFSDSTIYF